MLGSLLSAWRSDFERVVTVFAMPLLCLSALGCGGAQVQQSCPTCPACEVASAPVVTQPEPEPEPPAPEPPCSVPPVEAATRLTIVVRESGHIGGTEDRLVLARSSEGFFGLVQHVAMQNDGGVQTAAARYEARQGDEVTGAGFDQVIALLAQLSGRSTTDRAHPTSEDHVVVRATDLRREARLEIHHPGSTRPVRLFFSGQDRDFHLECEDGDERVSMTVGDASIAENGSPQRELFRALTQVMTGALENIDAP